jgi:hypothetical protein
LQNFAYKVELPNEAFRIQEQLDARNAQRLENLAYLVSGKVLSSSAVSESRPAVAHVHLDEQLIVSNSRTFPGLRSFVALCSRTNSLIASLESEIAGSQ